MGTKDYSALTSATGKGSNDQSGFGGLKQWEAIEKHALGPSDVTTLPGMEVIPFADADKPSGLVGQKLNDMSVRRLITPIMEPIVSGGSRAQNALFQQENYR